MHFLFLEKLIDMRIINVRTDLWKCQSLLSEFNENRIFSKDFLKK